MALTEKMAAYAENVREEVVQLLRDMCRIPAPSNHEEKRAEFCKNWFEKNGFTNVSIDSALNVIAPVNDDGINDLMVVMAHTDTVFPDLEPLPFEEKDGYIYCPGSGDDTANLAVLMVCARFFKDNCPLTDSGILFVANSGEEGLGNLKGTRKLMEIYGDRVKNFVSLDSSCMNRIVTLAVGSHRYKITAETEGGHSFSKFGNRNAIHVLASMISALYSINVPREGNSKTTFNVGTINGGTSVNTIAQQAEMMYEYRSDNKNCLAKMKEFFDCTVDMFKASGVEIEVEMLGERPCMSDMKDPEGYAKLKRRACESIREMTGLEVIEGSSSTDCNIPFSMGISAICFGVIRSAGAHTREEKVEVASLYDGCRLLLDFLYRK